MKAREWERRAITLFLLVLIAWLALRSAPPAEAAVPLAAAACLLSRIVAFYFPLPARRREPKNKS